jgi:hypothetical protein
MRLNRSAALVAAVLVVGCATKNPPPQVAASAPAPASPVVAAKAQDCVLLQNIRQTNVIDDSTIDFIMRDGKTLRNTLPHGCPQLGFERAFTYQTTITQLCSVDIITVLFQSGGIRRGASCGLGKFSPYTPIPKAAR